MARGFIRLTRPAIRALERGQRLAENGSVVERLDNGDARYSVNIQVDGQRIHRVVGLESDGVTRYQAETAIEKWRTEAREGRLDLPRGRKLHRSFADAAKEYIAELKEQGGKNIPIKERHLDQRLVPAFGKRRLDQITGFAVKHYARERRDAGASQATVNRELATLSHLYSHAVVRKWIKPDQRPEIEKGEEARKPITILTERQCAALMQAATEDPDQRLWLFVMFGLNAAMRHREILKARYDRIDWQRRRLHIPEAKAGEREQPLTKALIAALERQRKMERDPDGWIFPTLIKKQSKAGHRTNMARPFARAVVRAKLDPDLVTPHTMRHTAITRLIQAGVDLPTIQRISGHKTLAMVLRYTHIEGSHIDAALDKIESAFTGDPADIADENPKRGAVVSLTARRR